MHRPLGVVREIEDADKTLMISKKYGVFLLTMILVFVFSWGGRLELIMWFSVFFQGPAYKVVFVCVKIVAAMQL